MRSRNLRSLRSILLAVTAFAGAFLRPPAAGAQSFYYNEVVKDGRIYVFAVASRYDAFVKTNGQDIGTVITRPGYGPNGETVVFDSQEAINLYNFKHGLPGELPQAPEKPESKYPSGKLSGLMFGDYYWYYKWHQDQISSANPTSVEGQQGFWFRRIYFTYDWTYSEKLTTRFRLEANSNGQFEGGDINPYVKDAYVRWSYTGKHQLTLGIQPSLTFDWFDGLWGLRHIEKTPADLYRIDASRDFGISFNGPIGASGMTYAAQFGNDSGQGSENQEGKIVRFEGRFERSPGLALEGFYSYGTRPAGQDRQTAQGFAGFRNELLRVGGQYLWQERKSGAEGTADQTIGIWSGFVVWDFLPKKADLYFRADGVKGKLGSVETGLPGADGIDYWLLSPNSKFTMWIVGGEWYLHPSIRVGPNLELAKYANDPDPVNFPGRNQDSILRLTFFWTF
jgi:hypothetical protein